MNGKSKIIKQKTEPVFGFCSSFIFIVLLPGLQNSLPERFNFSGPFTISITTIAIPITVTIAISITFTII